MLTCARETGDVVEAFASPAVSAGPTHTGSVPACAEPADGTAVGAVGAAAVASELCAPEATATVAVAADGHTADGFGAAGIFGTATLCPATWCTGTGVPAEVAGACLEAAAALGTGPLSRPAASASTVTAALHAVRCRSALWAVALSGRLRARA
jgi:hypothetical protein